eukprot:scaffold3661_cov403-Prasinococcus_capsulatus_cf.AAC.2
MDQSVARERNAVECARSPRKVGDATNLARILRGIVLHKLAVADEQYASGRLAQFRRPLVGSSARHELWTHPWRDHVGLCVPLGRSPRPPYLFWRPATTSLLAHVRLAAPLRRAMAVACSHKDGCTSRAGAAAPALACSGSEDR